MTAATNNIVNAATTTVAVPLTATCDGSGNWHLK